MALDQLETLNSKVRVRKYILVSQPSRWRQKGGRVVVQSPMLEIPKNALQVPVKKSNGEGQNAVCLIPRQDIERDSSSIYARACVSKTGLEVDAHGVAVSVSPAEEEFEYRRGDQFWICIGSSTLGYDASVPVINLRTFKYGHIAIEHACWFPKIRGPNEELWTLGGEIRELKHSGSKKFTYWSWAICQKLDESLATTKNVEISARGSQLHDRSNLSIRESRFLFGELSQRMTQASCSFTAGESIPGITTTELSPTSASPVSLDIETVDAAPKAISADTQIQRFRSEPGDLELWKRIFLMAEKPMILHQNHSHPQELALSTINNQASRNAHPPRVPGAPKLNNGAKITSYTPLQSSKHHFPTRRPKSPQLDRDGRLTAEVRTRLGIPVHNQINNRPPLITYQSSVREKLRLPAHEDLCNIGDLTCRYSNRFTCRHFHSPPEKCTLNRKKTLAYTFSASPPSKRPRFVPVITSVPDNLSSQHSPHPHETNDQSTLAHEHCISRERPLPDVAGPCMLVEIPRLQHQCCHWTSSDRKSWTVVERKTNNSQDAKLQECRDVGMEFYDLTPFVVGDTPPSEDLQPGSGVGDVGTPTVLRGWGGEAALLANMDEEVLTGNANVLRRELDMMGTAGLKRLKRDFEGGL